MDTNKMPFNEPVNLYSVDRFVRSHFCEILEDLVVVLSRRFSDERQSDGEGLCKGGDKKD